MDTGLHVASFSWSSGPQATADTLAEVATIADQGSFASLHVMDHLFQLEIMGDAAEPMLEGYTTLGYLAGVTERIRLGLLVTGVTYRHPGMLAKIVTTVDVLSGGPRRARHRRRLVRAGARRAGCSLPAIVRAIRTARRDAADLPSDVVG